MVIFQTAREVPSHIRIYRFARIILRKKLTTYGRLGVLGQHHEIVPNSGRSLTIAVLSVLPLLNEYASVYLPNFNTKSADNP